MDDPSTTGITEGFGLMFYNARMYDPALGRFTSADTIIPGGVQGYDRYAYVNNSPVNFTDPSGHKCVSEGPGYRYEEQRHAITGSGSPANTGNSSGNGGGGGGNGGNDGGGDGGDSLENIIVDAFYNNPLGGSSSGCNTWILWNGSSLCHQNSYEPQPICLGVFQCSPEEQQKYAERFQYPGQMPWNPVVNGADRSVVGGDFFPKGSEEYKIVRLGYKLKVRQ